MSTQIEVHQNGKTNGHKNGKTGGCGRHPIQDLQDLANKWGLDFFSEEFAKRVDSSNIWPSYRHLFHYPKLKYITQVDKSLVEDEEADCIYFCGHSLGLEPKSTRDYIGRQLDKWAQIGAHGHLEGELPWATCQEALRPLVAKLVGAKFDEVDIMNFLTVNLHVLMITFYQPNEKRYKIIIEEKAFPSDHYVVESQIKLHNLDVKDALILLKPREGENNFRTEDIIDRINKEGDTVALVLLSGVHYFTGQFFDIERITKAAHDKGCYIGWDLAHAIGNVELHLHDWDVDFAAWCSYKYLNSGAGAIGGIYLNEKHFDLKSFKKLDGWWSHRNETRFEMNNKMEYAKGAAGYAMSNPSMLLCSCLKSSLDIFDQVGLPALRERSMRLTSYLEALIQRFVESNKHRNLTMESLTPTDPHQRGAMLSIKFSRDAEKMFAEIEKQGVVCDLRKPNVLRFAPTPLYNTFHEVYQFVQLLEQSFNRISED